MNKDTPIESNTWKTLSTKKIYNNPWILVEEHQVINPNGGKGIYGTVHLKNKAIAIVPIDEEGFTWLVGQYRYALNEYSWEIPMGGGPIELDILDSAKRELKEETGLLADQWTKVARVHTSNSVTDEEGFIFLAENLTQGETEFDETEDLKIWRLPFSEAVQMVLENKITDALSMIGLLNVANLRSMAKENG